MVAIDGLLLGFLYRYLDVLRYFTFPKFLD